MSILFRSLLVHLRYIQCDEKFLLETGREARREAMDRLAPDERQFAKLQQIYRC